MKPEAALRRQAVLPVVVGMTGMGVITFAVIGPALPDLATELGVSRGAIGLVQGAVAIPGIFLALVMGYLMDLRGRRLVAGISLALLAAGGLAAFFARDFWALVALRGVQGIGASGLLSIGVVVIGDLYDGDRRRWALGINAAGITVTALITPILGGFLADGGAFRPFLLFAVAIPLLPFVPLLPGRPSGPPPAPPLRHVGAMVREMRAGHRLSDFAGLLPFSLVAMVVFVGFGFTTTPLFLEREFAVDAAERGLIQAILSVGSTVTTLNTARLVSRYSPAGVLNVAFAGVTGSFVLLAYSPNLWVLGAGLLVLGSSLGLLFPLFQDFVASAVPAAYRGASVGSWVSSIRIGQTVGPIIAAGLADGIGERPSYAIGAIAMLVLTVAWRPARRVAARWMGPAPEGYRSIQGIAGPPG